MRAAVYTKPGGPEVIEIQERPRPEPGQGEVLVRVQASALNRADISQRLGGYPAPAGVPADIPGLEFAGEVEAAGAGVDAAWIGRRVFGLAGGGAHAEYLVSPAALLVPIPERLSMIEAGSVPEVFITASDALFALGELRPGDWVLLHAIGSGVSTAALQLAKAAGCQVIGTSRTAEKLARAKDLGLDAGVNVLEQDVVQAVREATGGHGVDVCLDYLGAPQLAANLASMAVKGRLVEVGLMGGASATINLSVLLGKRLKLIGTVLRARPLDEKAAATRLFAERVIPDLATGKVRPLVDRVFPLEQIADAHRMMEANQNFGKIVLNIASNK